MKTKDYIYLIVIILLLGASGFFVYKYFNLDKKFDVVVSERDNCINSPITVIYKDTTIYTHDTIFPEPDQSLLQEIYSLQEELTYVSKQPGDTVWMEKEKEDCESKPYSKVYKNNGFILHWEAFGNIDWIRFPKYQYPTKTITKIHDTCFNNPPQYKPLNHWGMEFNLIGNNLKQFPNLDAGVWWSIKDRVRLEVGGQWNMYHDEGYLRVGLAIPFNKRGRK